MFKKITKTFSYGQHQVILETGEIARQATGAVMVSMDNTVVLATVVAKKYSQPGQDFFPLTVDYLEKNYAVGRIPGGFLKREGRASEKEVLTSRLIDRPIRPLFPESYLNEVQVVVHVLSVNSEIDPDIPAMIGASAALAISGIPFKGPIGAARVAYMDGQYVLNPTTAQRAQSLLDLVVAGTETAVLMVESQAHELSEDIMLGAVVYGHEQMQTVINVIHDFVCEGGKPEVVWTPLPKDEAFIQTITELAKSRLIDAYQIKDKQVRTEQLQDIRTSIENAIALMEAGEGNTGKTSTSLIIAAKQILSDLEAQIVRSQVLSGEPRIDGRDTRTIRPIAIRTGVLPRTHGSALFTRGETQALVVATLGTSRDEQKIDALMGEYSDRFMLHYNMPPFATGEMGRVGAPKRREIGHGRLAKRALEAVLPTMDDFGYCIRLVSEIMESNGSSSMASVCGGCLALMDAGVPIKAHVAGIAMGLIKEGKCFAVLSDISGDEDHFGDMDFKVAGTEKGITALQMDIKIQGITKEIMQIALAQAKEGRMKILNIMKAALPQSQQGLSDFAPRLVTLKIHPDKIRDVIGKGGGVIRTLTEETGASIDISEEGLVTIASVNAEAGQEAKRRIEALTVSIDVGQVYDGVVVKLIDCGAIVQVLPGKKGLLHISQITNERITTLSKHLKEGQVVKVKVVEVNDQGRLKLSMKELLLEGQEQISKDETSFCM